ncbi:MAG: high-affinity branched-chain amino acid ABC transporter ATP-binding protein LivG, partial [Gammaproteobacteria bacterium]|nr:high-affinity branched-chain amino acid ABC transporter ATP-binding protein LivG [Gammaproteobacteria bacterium]NIT62774.1 high-affinity branched-chain amino acid ABC transporter ATP-binding protein LivG [Gammaproteobacteria bacterium]NIV21134.1 high-affinity branched-chain amino acid ABC transporter ATP-binding protein LivG [Gammaproteobacteria bacterium]NIX10031.1 high-affinity branched-chain amino acid ABC transporter ATP-binding protein LivG [Gammaproteobacteria bacterium]NIY31354.1 high
MGTSQEKTERLAVNDLAKAFGGVLALNGVSLIARSRQILSIIGPNG